MFVEEGFRVRFANGEVIDFYADSTTDKDGWMRVLAEVVGKDNKSTRSWTEIVLRRERSLATKAAKNGTVAAPNHVAMKSAPNTPAKHRYSHSQSQPQLPQQQLQPGQAARNSAAASNKGNGSPTKMSFSRPFSQIPTPGRPNSADKPLPQTQNRGQISEAERSGKSRSMLF